MTDRNDALLLKCGWQYLKSDADYNYWVRPGVNVGDDPDFVDLCLKHAAIQVLISGEHIFGGAPLPRPYDNLQDAVDCVPEGYCFLLGTNNQRSFVTVSKNGGLGDEETVWVASGFADTPAEALAEAISKAVNHD